MARSRISGKALSAMPAKHRRGLPEARPYDCFLNYNVRTMIYDNITFAPFSDERDYVGIALSCKSALAELREAAGRHLKIYLLRFEKQFKKDTGLKVRLPNIPLVGQWTALTNLTITLPPAAMTRATFWFLLRPLFSLRLDKLIILYRADAASARNALHHSKTSSYCDSLWKNARCTRRPWLQRACILQDMMSNYIEHNTSVFLRGLSAGGPMLFELFRTKHIVIAWDFRAQPMIDAGKGRGAWLMQGLVYEATDDFKQKFMRRESVQSNYSMSLRYELAGKGGLIGAFGLVSSARWASKEKGRHLFWNGFNTRKAIGSDGFDRDIVVLEKDK